MKDLTIANQVVTGLNGGTFKIFTTASDVIVDVAGYFTGSSAGSSTNGLFVSLSPFRLLDTAPQPRSRRRAGPTPGSIASSSGVAAIVANLTITNTGRDGFVTAYAANTALPETSSVNSVRGGQTIANHITPPRIGLGGRAVLEHHDRCHRRRGRLLPGDRGRRDRCAAEQRTTDVAADDRHPCLSDRGLVLLRPLELL
ncbi:MAG: hypothetical protein R2705_11000 [Ilumatobacteraceae bacterium]